MGAKKIYGDICVIDGCGKPFATRGWCYGHYRKWLKYGDPNIALKATPSNPKYCTIVGCEKRLRCKGLCQLHYSRLREYGNANHKPQIHRKLNGHKDSPTHQTYRGMIERCYKSYHRSYKNYGGRGITVCARWIDSFDAFVEDMGIRPENKTLDRINPDGNYEPHNCRWASAKTQSRNKRNTRKVQYNGEVVSLMALAEKHDIPYRRLVNRVVVYNWPIERALSKEKFVNQFK